jgi:hypothetical protein
MRLKLAISILAKCYGQPSSSSVAPGRVKRCCRSNSPIVGVTLRTWYFGQASF